MPTLSLREIYDAARAAGFSQHDAVTWTAIALAESGGRSGALNDRGEHSMGLWQINVAGDVRENKWGNLNDPTVNARAAFDISRGGRDMRPWTTTHDHNKGTAADYRTYLPKVEAEIGVKGDPRGVSGYGAMLPPPLEYSSYDRIDSGRSLDVQPIRTPDDAAVPAEPEDAGKDSDSDGLTDAFERLAGTDAKDKDSDNDSLSDSFEAISSHTDPLRKDTDSDGVTDAAELAAGSDAGRLPGVAGVVGSGVFAENVRGGVKDADSDGLSDHAEKLVGTDPSKADSDSDQLNDAAEAALGTDPNKADSDYDGLTDGFEVQHRADPLSPLLDPTGRSVPITRWTVEGAYQRRLADQQGNTSANGAEPASSETGTSGQPSSSALHTFLAVAKAQKGDPYVYGADPRMADKNPDEFDCSALTQWAAHRAGVELPRIAEAQYMQAKENQQLISVEEALRTPGALLFYFSEEPKGPLPAGKAHVAISTGDGRTIEARGSSWDVGTFSAKGRSFNYAAVIPGISDDKGQQEYRAFQGNSGRQPDMAEAPLTTQISGRNGDGTAAAAADGIAATGSLPGDPYGIEAGAQLGTTAQLPGAKANDPDTDLDGLTDAFEKLAGTNPNSKDSDKDGLADGYEALTSHTDPLRKDTDSDGPTDAAEVAAGTDAGKLPGVAGVVGSGAFAENIRGGVKDADSDGLSDHAEKILRTNARKADTDGDQLNDAAELALNTNPLLGDTDNDGLFDGIEIQYDTDPLNPGHSLRTTPSQPDDDPDQTTPTTASLLDG